MAAVDVRAVKEQASALVAKGRFEQAEVLYRQALTMTPRDAQLWVRHGETLRRGGRHGQAIESFRMAANILATDGHDARAIVALKLALELRPSDVELISDIIRLELRASRVVPLETLRRIASGEFPLDISVDEAAVRALTMETTPAPRPQLALPMAPASAPRRDFSIHDAVTRPGNTPVLRPPPPMTDMVFGDRTDPALPTFTPPSGSTQPLRDAVTQPNLEPQPPGEWPRVKRLSDTEIALQASESSPWAIFSSVTPVQVRYEVTLPSPEEPQS